MSVEITDAFVRAYGDNFLQMMQQKESALQGTVMVDTGVQGKAKSFERIGATISRTRTSRHSDTYNVDTPHSRRWAVLATEDWGDLIDPRDKRRINSLLDPQNAYIQAGTAALNRKKDTIIIAALEGSALAGEEAATSVALPSAQKIATSSVGLNVEKIITAAQMLNLADADPDEEKFIVYGPKQLTNMLGEIEVTSSDYAAVKSLVEGRINTWMGFKWIMSNRLTLSSTTRYCYAYLKRACGLAIGEDIVTKVAERSDKSFSIQCWAEMDMGAVRIEDEAVIQIACTEA